MAAKRKSYPIISVADVEPIFDDACIVRLAQIGRLPAAGDLRLFGPGVREAARSYAGEARNPTINDVHSEIAQLHWAAEKQQFEEVANLLRILSPTARNLLSGRGLRPSLAAALPDPERLFDGACREAACAAVGKLCRFGAGWVEGRVRPSGIRSRTWRTELFAPKPRRQP